MFFVFLSLLASYYLSTYIGLVLGINMHSPANTQPHGQLFDFIMLTTFVSSVITFYLLSFVFQALVLRYFFKWKTDKIYKLIFHSEIPEHWLKKNVT